MNWKQELTSFVISAIVTFTAFSAAFYYEKNIKEHPCKCDECQCHEVKPSIQPNTLDRYQRRQDLLKQLENFEP